MHKIMLAVRSEIGERFRILFPLLFPNQCSSLDEFVSLVDKREVKEGETIKISVDRYGGGSHYVMRITAPVGDTKKIEYDRFDGFLIGKRPPDAITDEKNYVKFLLEAIGVKGGLERALGKEVELIDLFGNSLSEDAIERVYDKADELEIEGGSDLSILTRGRAPNTKT